jgi:hypothetical protein
MDKSALNKTSAPKGAAYCDKPGTSCFYGMNDLCVNCFRRKGWRKSRLKGDGRIMLEAMPKHVRPDTQPLRIRRGTARMIINWFERNGFSSHSAMGGTLWLIIEYCEHHKIPYMVTGSREMGYYVERMPQ